MKLRDEYMRADRDPVTENDLANMIRRSFAAQICDDGELDDDEHKEMLTHLIQAHHVLRLATARAKDDENGIDTPTDVLTVTDTAAERCYFQAYISAHVKAGASEGYAEESAWWPDALPLKAPWDPELLAELARLEVGSELVTADYIRERIKREQTNGGA